MNTVAEKIRLRREELGLSQEFVAAELGITQPTYAQIESGKSKLSLERAVALTSILQISILELIGGASTDMLVQHNELKDQAQIIQHYQASNAELYESMIQDLKGEILFLREQLAAALGTKMPRLKK